MVEVEMVVRYGMVVTPLDTTNATASSLLNNDLPASSRSVMSSPFVLQSYTPVSRDVVL